MVAQDCEPIGLAVPLLANDEAAIMRAARDDLAQFAPLYTVYAPRVYAFCLRRVGSAQEAEDLTSRIFERALKGLCTYRGGSVAAWLFRIARRAVADHFREMGQPTVSLESVEHHLTDRSLTPAEQVERRTLLRALVSTLSASDQELLALKIGGELTSQEIGEIVGRRAGAVRAQLRRILKRLRALCPEELV